MSRSCCPLIVALAVVVVPLLVAGCHPRVATPADTPKYQPESTPAPPREIPQKDIATLRRNFKRIFFEFDSARLTADARQALADNAAILTQYTQVAVTVEGHCDQWGSDEYNLALGERRAEAVRSYLLSLGVLERQLRAISFGEEHPLVGAGTKPAEAPNRRAEFSVTAGQDLANSSGVEVTVTIDR